jgi:hypothetical protein
MGIIYIFQRHIILIDQYYVTKLSGCIQGLIRNLKTKRMKKLFYFLLCMILIMLFAGGSMAQQLVGESDPFVFDTRQAAIPLSNSVLLIFFILASSLILYRFYWQKKKAAL